MTTLTRGAIALLTLMICLAPARAQDVPIVAPDPALSQLPRHPALTLGARAATLEARRPVARTLVLARSERAAMQEIARWSPEAYWPVLIDDGSERAASDIARFVRAFEPERIVIAPDEDAAKPGAEELADALASSWGAGDDGLAGAFDRRGWVPPGLVVTDADHGPALAALALAAGRGQPLLFIDAQRHRGNDVLDNEERDTLVRAIGAHLRAHPWTWDAIGDDIDAVTLCLDTEGRVRDAGGTTIALTDRIGRDPGGRRWAYAGWIRGRAPAALYDAMCALFVADAQRFWIFDGYEADFAPPFAANRARPPLERAGRNVRFAGPPNNLPRDWRGRTRGALDADVVHVNSSGEPWRFQLGAHAQRAYGSDVPALAQPALVHFIHSFSAQRVGVGSTIAARWLDEGAYAYVGSVEEPRLGAFLPAHAFLPNLLAGASFGAAARQDNLGPWRIQVFGDPLATFGEQEPPEPDAAPTFDGYRTLEDELASAAGARELAHVVRTLVMLGRWSQGAEVLRAALDSEEEGAPSVGPEAALYGLAIAERVGDVDLCARCAQRLPPSTWDDPRHSARLWRTLRPALDDGRADGRVLGLLRGAERRESAADDAAALEPSFLRVFSRATADAVLERLAEIAQYPADRERIREMLAN